MLKLLNKLMDHITANFNPFYELFICVIDIALLEEFVCKNRGSLALLVAVNLHPLLHLQFGAIKHHNTLNPTHLKQMKFLHAILYQLVHTRIIFKTSFDFGVNQVFGVFVGALVHPAERVNAHSLPLIRFYIFMPLNRFQCWE